MKTLIIYASVHHGNTKKIGRVMAETLNADIINIKDLNTHKLEKLETYDLMGFGSGIYYGKFHKSMINLIDKLPVLSNKKAFIFSTSSLGKNKYNNSIGEKLKSKGFKVISNFACKGYDTFGPFKLVGGIGKGRPNENDFKKARDFCKKMIKA